MTELAQQLAAHPRFVWMPGMAAQSRRYPTLRAHRDLDHYNYDPDSEGIVFLDTDSNQFGVCELGELRPDLSDPATQGCLLAMLRGCAPDHETESHSGGVSVVHVFATDGLPVTTQITFTECLGEALAQALLAVWDAE